MKLSRHSRKRLKERANINKNNQKQFFISALKNGISLNIAIQKGYDQSVIKYLWGKEKKYSKVKIYKGYVFAYSRNKKQLYTIYKCPEHIQDAINKKEKK